ncbi:hypothetical protein BGAL_0075g00250 [Botrytis galanthina]|uniref:Uncharacterized protein n=1 Tax=Botrytis galanthina TaxID=278940 RepID=A0A4S8RDQ4_9HELO|nr:hypothetical protein BGAL_0075g00250 [Botrytis galanthina]
MRALELMLGLGMFFSCVLGTERLGTMRTREWALPLWVLGLNMLSSRLFILKGFIAIATDPALNVSSYSAVRYHMRIGLKGDFAGVTSRSHCRAASKPCLSQEAAVFCSAQSEYQTRFFKCDMWMEEVIEKDLMDFRVLRGIDLAKDLNDDRSIARPSKGNQTTGGEGRFLDGKRENNGREERSPARMDR